MTTHRSRNVPRGVAVRGAAHAAPSRVTRRSSLVLAAGLALACGTSRTYVWASQLPPPDPNEDKVILPGDKLQVVVANQLEMSGEFDVRPGGEVVLPTAGRFNTAGRTADALAAEVTNRLRGVLADPRVTILIAVRPPPTVSVLGEVKTAGRYALTGDEGVLDVLARAGGLSTFADEDSIFVIRHDRSSPRVRFRYSDLVAAEAASVRFRLRDGDAIVVE